MSDAEVTPGLQAATPAAAKPKPKLRAKPKSKAAAKPKAAAAETVIAKFPRHTVEQALRIPEAILQQNAGNPTTPNEAVIFSGG